MASTVRRYTILEEKLPPVAIAYASGDEVSMLIGLSSAVDHAIDFLISATFLLSRWTWASIFFLSFGLGQIEPVWALIPFGLIPLYFVLISVLYFLRFWTYLRFGWDAPCMCSVLKCRSEPIPIYGKFVQIALIPSSNYLLSGSKHGAIDSDEMLKLDHSVYTNLEEVAPVVTDWVHKSLPR
jgi:hypothetical protein